ncbi:MAG: hypothetical protein Q4B17_06700 [Lautropia sp.]|nr:hypothetical protein [Lautropia sp.]
MSLHLSDYPQLCLLAWNRDPDEWIDEAEAFALYEANWRHVDQAQLEAREKALIERLTQEYGHGVMNV